MTKMWSIIAVKAEIDTDIDMEMPNATKICNTVGGYQYCDKCPIYAVCCADYQNTEDFEKALENAAIEYLKGVIDDKL